MAIDPDRAAFVKQAYRYATAENTSVKTAYQSARELVHETNLRSSGAISLLGDYFNAVSTTSLAFEVVVEGVYSLEDFVDAPPRFTCNFRDYETASREYRVIAISPKPMLGITVLTVRG